MRFSPMILVLLLVIAALFFVFQWKREPAERSFEGNLAEGAPKELAWPEGLSYEKGSLFSKRYGAADGTIEEDLTIVQKVFEHAVILVKNMDSLPLADNADFTKLLTGGNLQRYAWIHPAHPLVREGELLDRWGTPLFFHRESARRTSIRSAGEDGKMWTDDDVEFSQSSIYPKGD